MSLLSPKEHAHLLRVLEHAQAPVNVSIKEHTQEIKSLLVSAAPGHLRDDLCFTELGFTDDLEELRLLQTEVRRLIEQHPSQYDDKGLKLIYTAGYQLNTQYPSSGLRILRLTTAEYQFARINQVQDQSQRSNVLDVRCASAINMEQAVELLSARQWTRPIQNAPALAHELFTDLLPTQGTAHLCETTWITPEGTINLPALAYLHPLHTHGYVVSQNGEACLLTEVPLNATQPANWSNRTQQLQQATILETLTLPRVEVTDHPSTTAYLENKVLAKQPEAS